MIEKNKKLIYTCNMNLHLKISEIDNVKDHKLKFDDGKPY